MNEGLRHHHHATSPSSLPLTSFSTAPSPKHKNTHTKKHIQRDRRYPCCARCGLNQRRERAELFHAFPTALCLGCVCEHDGGPRFFCWCHQRPVRNDTDKKQFQQPTQKDTHSLACSFFLLPHVSPSRHIPRLLVQDASRGVRGPKHTIWKNLCAKRPCSVFVFCCSYTARRVCACVMRVFSFPRLLSASFLGSRTNSS